MTADDEFVDEGTVSVQLGVGLGDVILCLFHCGEVKHVIRHLAVDDAAVRAFDEAVLVDAGKGRQ